jgi:hypothetical protein
MGDFESARSLIQDEIVINGIPANGTCYTLNRVFESIKDSCKPAIGDIIQSIKCDHSKK